MIAWHEILDGKHCEILKKISMNPTPSNIPWSDIQSLLEELREKLGGRVDVVYGGRIRIKLDNGPRGVVHQADLAGFTAIGNVREIKGLIENKQIKAFIESMVIRTS